MVGIIWWAQGTFGQILGGLEPTSAHPITTSMIFMIISSFFMLLVYLVLSKLYFYQTSYTSHNL